MVLFITYERATALGSIVMPEWGREGKSVSLNRVPKTKKITIYKSSYWTLGPTFAILMAFGFDCAPGERTSSPFFAHSSHRTSHIPHPTLLPFPPSPHSTSGV
jgi:hypothetical protein